MCRTYWEITSEADTSCTGPSLVNGQAEKINLDWSFIKDNEIDDNKKIEETNYITDFQKETKVR